MSEADRAAFDPVGDPLSGFQFGELALGALGVLAVSTEYASGMIRTTLTATPRRSLVYAAKTLTLAGRLRLPADHLLLINAATALATVNPPAGPHAGRIPSPGFALFDLALYLAVFLGLGAWRAQRDT